MDIFSIFTLAGGVAVFLYGMDLMGRGLQQAASDKMQSLLARLTSNIFKAVLLGATVTAVIQSSSATTVMVVGLVNSGIMDLYQAVGVIMGANIGTTITAWILSLAGIQGDTFLLRLLNPSGFAPILAVIGIVFILFSKKEKRVNVGMIFFGFAILMLGLNTMSGTVAPLKDNPKFAEFFLMFENPVLGVLVGAVLTAIIQSSSASVGILQALAATGSVTWGSAIPIIMGQNIGTCVTAIISGIGAKKSAKRAAIIHLLFNMVGTTIFIFAFYSLNMIRPLAFLADAVAPAGIASVHTIFNVTATIILLPFHKLLVKLSILVLKDTPEEKEAAELVDIEKERFLQILDPRFLETPGFALSKATEAVNVMADISVEAVVLAVSMNNNPTQEILDAVIHKENLVDAFEDELQTYLLRLSQRQLGDREAIDLNIMMHAINDLERMSDHGVNIAEAFLKQAEGEESFSDEAKEELNTLILAVQEILAITGHFFASRKNDRSEEIEALEEVIDNLAVELQNRHIERLKARCCSVEAGFLFSDIVTALERISDHCANISFYIHDLVDGDYDRHQYKSRIQKNNEEFARYYETYHKKYTLPAKTVYTGGSLVTN